MTRLALEFLANMVLVSAGTVIGVLAERHWLHPRFVASNTRLVVDRLWSAVLTGVEDRRSGILRAGKLAMRHRRTGVVYEDREALDRIQPYQVVIKEGQS